MPNSIKKQEDTDLFASRELPFHRIHVLFGFSKMSLFSKI